jgi:hypothetical protein
MKIPLSKYNILTELNMEKCYPTLVKAVSRDWLCSAPKRSGKIEHFAGICCSNPENLDILLAKKGSHLEVV